MIDVLVKPFYFIGRNEKRIANQTARKLNPIYISKLIAKQIYKKMKKKDI